MTVKIQLKWQNNAEGRMALNKKQQEHKDHLSAGVCSGSSAHRRRAALKREGACGKQCRCGGEVEAVSTFLNSIFHIVTLLAYKAHITQA